MIKNKLNKFFIVLMTFVLCSIYCTSSVCAYDFGLKNVIDALKGEYSISDDLTNTLDDNDTYNGQTNVKITLKNANKYDVLYLQLTDLTSGDNHDVQLNKNKNMTECIVLPPGEYLISFLFNETSDVGNDGALKLKNSKIVVPPKKSFDVKLKLSNNDILSSLLDFFKNSGITILILTVLTIVYLRIKKIKKNN